MPKSPLTALGLFKSEAPFSPCTITTSRRLLHVSGQVAQGPDGKTIGIGDVAIQAEVAIENLRKLVIAANASLDDVCRIVIYLVSRDHLAPVIAARRKHFSEPYPAATVVVVAGLANPEWLVEIEATAALPD